MRTEQPNTLAEAIPAAGSAVFAGGCTDLMPLLKQGVRQADRLVLISRIPELQGIQVEGQEITIGAAVTLREIADSPLLNRVLPAAAQAAGRAASPQIRNIGTVGGNLLQDRRCIYFNQSKAWRDALEPCFKTGGRICHQMPNSPCCRAICYSDMATPLVLYEARAEYWEDGSLRCVSLEDLLKRHSESNGCSQPLPILLTRIRIPVPPEGEQSGFYKYAMRTSIDFPLINFAMRCQSNRPPKLVAGAVAPAPVCLEETACLLNTDASDVDIVAACRAELQKKARPIREERKRDLYGLVSALLPLRRSGTTGN